MSETTGSYDDARAGNSIFIFYYKADLFGTQNYYTPKNIRHY